MNSWNVWLIRENYLRIRHIAAKTEFNHYIMYVPASSQMDINGCTGATTGYSGLHEWLETELFKTFKWNISDYSGKQWSMDIEMQHNIHKATEQM